ncbi:MAG: undecaprenyl/decaprenyl-phosphate alpha-N-acetylglucosaminyl 1-phosphate transferase [Oscillospiraceae bacterium]|nr:undecaprenyl/decaprenyl-phosphate alpha-N-acetylglucosaminyl 1-phosphate transferase [Oscillospiraceae bacterium]
MDIVKIIFGCAGMLFAFLIAFTTTPVVRVIAFKIGAIDDPKRDDRRMHKEPTPRIGGLAIFIGFVSATMLFAEYSPTLLAIWFGGLILVVMGVLDDIFRLNAFLKLGVQILVALIAVWQGMTIEFINLFGHYIVFGYLEIPITILWIVGLTNAINFIDGLDGLSCGVSAICSISLLLVTLTTSDNGALALVMAIMAGSCLGFLPYNSNPAKIFMGDSGALFLGYTFAVLSIEGLFKFNMVMSFLIPLSIFGVPLFDTVFAIIRRTLKGKNPFTTPDKGHIHHRLINMGFNQKQSVHILYAISGILGISAIMLANELWIKTIGIIIIGVATFVINYFIVKSQKTRDLAGFDFGVKSDEDKPQ